MSEPKDQQSKDIRDALDAIARWERRLQDVAEEHRGKLEKRAVPEMHRMRQGIESAQGWENLPVNEKWDRHAKLMEERGHADIAEDYAARGTFKPLLKMALIQLCEAWGDIRPKTYAEQGNAEVAVKALDEAARCVDALLWRSAMDDLALIVSDRNMLRVTQAVREIANAFEKLAEIRGLKIPRGLETYSWYAPDQTIINDALRKAQDE